MFQRKFAVENPTGEHFVRSQRTPGHTAIGIFTSEDLAMAGCEAANEKVAESIVCRLIELDTANEMANYLIRISGEHRIDYYRYDFKEDFLSVDQFINNVKAARLIDPDEDYLANLQH